MIVVSYCCNILGVGDKWIQKFEMGAGAQVGSCAPCGGPWKSKVVLTIASGIELAY